MLTSEECRTITRTKATPRRAASASNVAKKSTTNTRPTRPASSSTSSNFSNISDFSQLTSLASHTPSPILPLVPPPPLPPPNSNRKAHRENRRTKLRMLAGKVPAYHKSRNAQGEIIKHKAECKYWLYAYNSLLTVASHCSP